MHEFELHQILMEHPSLIEDGLTYLDREVGMGGRLRCDLLFKDREGRSVYVEVKWKAGRRAVVQIEQYEVVSGKRHDDARFVLASVDVGAGIEEIVRRRGFEFKRISAHKLSQIRPEWEELLAPKSVPARGSSGTRTPSGSADLLLRAIYERLVDDLPDAYLNRGKKPRILLNWADNDYFNFYFSREVPDGFRCAFVLDLDVKDSNRRLVFQDTLRNAVDKVEEIYGLPVYQRSDRIVAVELKRERWIKIMRHRWYSIYVMNRLGELNPDRPDETAERIVPLIYEFIERTDSLLHLYRPPN